MTRINLNSQDFESRKTYYNKIDLIKTYKNNSKDYQVVCSCDRCDGRGYISFSSVDSSRCWKCNTTGKVKVIIHVSDDVPAQLTAEEVQKRWEAIYAKNKQNNLNLGYKLIDFTLAGWLKGIWFNYDSYYRIAKETDKAYLIKRLDDITSLDHNAIEFWVPKSAIKFTK